MLDHMPSYDRIVYQWSEGAVPPPYHYEYAVTLARDGAGAIRLLPDYEQHRPPAMEAVFRVPAGSFGCLADALAEAMAIDRAAPPRDSDAPLGGSVERWELYAEGKAPILLTIYPLCAGLGLAALSETVRGLVPPEVWRRLFDERAAYWRAQGEPLPPEDT
ncbi:MAG: hypothetical protein M5U22_08025 [Thermoleophilia bacterium]|nr:hypothetical protein [Thermoleophilia bacterium]